MSHRINIEQVNDLDKDEFDKVFSNIIELCPDAAVQVRKRKPFDSLFSLATAFNKYLDDLSEQEKVTVLKLHPDLAGKLVSGELTRESSQEQKSAGLDKLTEDQRSVIQASNDRYKTKFGFPFIICARENKVESIIEGLRDRYNNTKQQEILNGINEVKKIAKLRLADIVKCD
ncbi:hypothetical protein O0L34_g8841 [Tuta absoluta]|nr:hypothetical protein O0L34_g8841 [Tuta absoluta]